MYGLLALITNIEKTTRIFVPLKIKKNVFCFIPFKKLGSLCSKKWEKCILHRLLLIEIEILGASSAQPRAPAFFIPSSSFLIRIHQQPAEQRILPSYESSGDPRSIDPRHEIRSGTRDPNLHHPPSATLLQVDLTFLQTWSYLLYPIKSKNLSSDSKEHV